MKNLYVLQLFVYGQFYSEASYRFGPYVVRATTGKAAILIGVRDLIERKKLKKSGRYSGVCLVTPVSMKWMKWSNKSGMLPFTPPKKFMFRWKKEEDTVTLKEVEQAKEFVTVDQ